MFGVMRRGDACGGENARGRAALLGHTLRRRAGRLKFVVNGLPDSGVARSGALRCLTRPLLCQTESVLKGPALAEEVERVVVE